jgi:hypothetical protein
MRLLKRFIQLTGAERRILIRVLLVVGVARAALWALPLEKARRAVARASAGVVGGSVEQVVWAVRVASRYLPGATCLTQALAAQALLTHSGFPAQVEIGVAKDSAKDSDEEKVRQFRAHAWVVCHGQVVLGGQPGPRYNSLIVWDQQE